MRPYNRKAMRPHGCTVARMTALSRQQPNRMALICTLDIEMARLKLTTASLAKQLGINESTISKLRRNQFSMIDVKNFEKICLALKLQPGDLLHIESQT